VSLTVTVKEQLAGCYEVGGGAVHGGHALEGRAMAAAGWRAAIRCRGCAPTTAEHWPGAGYDLICRTRDRCPSRC
jgi:hypothetical protein